MDDPMMSAAFQPQSAAPYQPSNMDFPTDFLEPEISPAPMSVASLQSTKPPQSMYYSPITDYSSPTSDSGIASSNVTLANEDPSSGMQFLSSALTSAVVADCMDNTGAPFDSGDLLDDFEPMMRDRCNTWPIRRPNVEFQSNNSPLMHERIAEEELSYSRNGSQASINLVQPEPFIMNNNNNSGNAPNNNANSAMNIGYSLENNDIPEQDELNYDSSHYSDGANSPDNDDYPGVQKRSQTRRNAWGNMSYADLITQAILSSPDQRLTLSQVYEWMVQNVPYFSDKGDSNSSAGWKNSIRHNLSLHSRFMRIQNEGAGKSSWWVINPEAKTGRNQGRRRATMDATTKSVIEKKRRGARKRVEMQMHQSQQGSMSSLAAQQQQSHKVSQPFETFGAKDEFADDSDYDSFRSRTLSNMSAPGGSQVSPTLGGSADDFKYPAWNTSGTLMQNTPTSATLTEIMDRTDQICLDPLDGEYSNHGASFMPSQQISPSAYAPQQLQPLQQSEDVKPSVQFQNQASYQELSTVRNVNQQMQNPLLRTQYSQPSGQFQSQRPQQQQQQQQQQFTAPQPMGQPPRNAYPFGCNGIANQQRWHQVNTSQQQQPPQPQRFVPTSAPYQQVQSQQPQSAVQRQLSQPPLSAQAIVVTMAQSNVGVNPQLQSTNNPSNNSPHLPRDLENLNTFMSSDCGDVDELIAREFASTTNCSTSGFNF